jgi:hypothetical protein
MVVTVVGMIDILTPFFNKLKVLVNVPSTPTKVIVDDVAVVLTTP